ncbi:MAG: LysM peptidoglycan-binding domain-containing protein [Mycobacteriales bacterium]
MSVAVDLFADRRTDAPAGPVPAHLVRPVRPAQPGWAGRPGAPASGRVLRPDASSPASGPTLGTGCAGRGGQAARTPGPWRLTRAGRLATAIVVALVMLTLGWQLAQAVVAPAPVIPASAPAVVRVRPGDTLWSIAGQLAPTRDPRAVVAALEARNGLRSAMIRPGQLLRVRS